MKDINFFKEKDSLFFKKISSKKDLNPGDLCDGYVVKSSEAECRKILASLNDRKRKMKVAFVGGDDKFNRRALETLKIDYLISPEEKTLPDTLKQRDSGLNHVTAKIAKQKDIIILVDMSALKPLNSFNQSSRLVKIMQNIKLARRVKAKIKIVSFANSKKGLVSQKARISLGLSLGMSSLEASQSVKL